MTGDGHAHRSPRHLLAGGRALQSVGSRGSSSRRSRPLRTRRQTPSDTLVGGSAGPHGDGTCRARYLSSSWSRTLSPSIGDHQVPERAIQCEGPRPPVLGRAEPYLPHRHVHALPSKGENFAIRQPVRLTNRTISERSVGSFPMILSVSPGSKNRHLDVVHVEEREVWNPRHRLSAVCQSKRGSQDLNLAVDGRLADAGAEAIARFGTGGRKFKSSRPGQSSQSLARSPH